MDADGSNRKRLVKNAFSTTSSATTLSWSPDGRRLYYTRQGVLRGAATVNDIWAWDFDRGREIRITRGLRARDAHPSPDGRTLALVTVERGLTRLALLDLDGQLPARTPSRLRPLTEFSADQFAEPRWSPDGLRIAVSARMPGGEQEIRILDREARLLARVGHEGALDGAPAWSPDGRRLFFSSDSTGIFNIFAWDAATNEITQVTNVLGGAFSPAPSPDGRRLAFADYTARGYDLRVMELDPRYADDTASDRASRLTESAAVPRDPMRNPLGGGVARRGGLQRGSGARPMEVRSDRTPQPDGNGCSSRDRLLPARHAPAPPLVPVARLQPGKRDARRASSRAARTCCSATATRSPPSTGPKSGRLMHWADYAYDGLRPTLRLSSSDFDRTYGDLLQDDHGVADYTERVRSIGADITLDFPGFDSSQAITVGYRYRELSGLTPLPPWPGYDGVSAGDRPARFLASRLVLLQRPPPAALDQPRGRPPCRSLARALPGGVRQRIDLHPGLPRLERVHRAPRAPPRAGGPPLHRRHDRRPAPAGSLQPRRGRPRATSNPPPTI